MAQPRRGSLGRHGINKVTLVTIADPVCRDKLCREESNMNFKRIAIAGAFWIFLGALMAEQDPTVVEPKHYKLAFENDEVQVVDVHYGPHEKSKLHSHPGGVVVYITEGHLKFTDENGNVKEVYAKPGEARFFPPFKHSVENLRDKPFDAVYVGLKKAGEKK